MGLGDIGLSGLTISSMKKHPAILPMYFFLACGLGLSIAASIRTLVKHPEISIARSTNPEAQPWNDYSDRQYKFFAFGRDYSQSASQAPKF